MQCYSFVENGQDVIDDTIQQIIQTDNIPWNSIRYQQKLSTKITEIIKNYERRNFQIDGQTVKHLEEQFFEFRIQAGGTSLLIRIFFFHFNPTTIVLTGNLIKPQSYDDKKQKEKTDQNYQIALTTSKYIQQDFFWPQNFTYQLLTF